ncbi:MULTISPECIES: GNAT family N-acetyltransferase [Thermomonas]|uniref:GNAT family N-acetyltransferase n=1 Tax=Thermomonas beijingensis TaxID=2872701 RepID=A0ABS7TAF6_9GAMM|nr:GNAT family N-acetyltransferase [Thermomonas beijingensis]MBZ4184840.1 GNAT family N-acetyltransferase [Thermomonas beijingensis]
MTDTLIAIRPATPDDVPLIRQLIVELAEYERMRDAAVATDAALREQLFGAQPVAEVLLGEVDGQPAGFALFFHNFSTFLGQRGLYLEDLFVRPQFRGAGLGKRLMATLARLAVQRGCGRFEWSVLDWNTPSIGFYRSIGAVGMDEWTVQRLQGDALHALAARDEL